MKKILGLDLGTNSIGWALIEQDIKNDAGKILGVGSRIIPMSQDILGEYEKGNSISQTAERTRLRSTRRLRERHLLRRERLHRVLNVLGFLPKHYAGRIDFDNRLGKFIPEIETKLAYDESGKFIFKKSFEEMITDFQNSHPALFDRKNGRGEDPKLPYDWTIYYLRKKAIRQKIETEELAWLLLHFNKKRGYYQLRGEDEESPNKLEEYHSLSVTAVTADEQQPGKAEIWYNIILENGWIYRRASKLPLFDWTGMTRDFIVTTELNGDGTIKTDKEGKEKRSFRSPKEDDWKLLKKKTEFDIERAQKTVGEYIYDALLAQPDQKIKGKLIRTIERKYYKQELVRILAKQVEFHEILRDRNVFMQCVEELYPHNLQHQASLSQKDFVHLFVDDILYYQRPLRSQKSAISNCPLEARGYLHEGIWKTEALKCIPKSHPLFQEFRLWQWLNNLRIHNRESEMNETGRFLRDTDDYANLFEFLHNRKEIDQKTLLKFFKLKEQEFRWNYVEDKRYPCNETRALITARLNKIADLPDNFLTAEKETELWHLLYSVTDQTEFEKALRSFARKNQLDVDSFFEAFRRFPPFASSYGGYSAKAIKRLLPLMRAGKFWNEKKLDKNVIVRIEKIINGEYDEAIHDRVREKTTHFGNIRDFQMLPEWLAKYVAYDRHSERGETGKWESVADLEDYLATFRQHSLKNPVVEQVLTETLRVVRDIWLEYGKGAGGYFDEIHVELARDLKNPRKERERLSSQISKNENRNLRIKALLSELLNDPAVENVRPGSPMQQDILKIYEEGVLDSAIEIPEDIQKISRLAYPTAPELQRYKLWLEQKYRSPYTGEIIPLNKLFTPAYEVEHVIPQQRYFDDSLSNKVICESAVNKRKANQTGMEFIQNHHGEIVELGFGKQTKVFSEEEYIDFVRRHFAGNRSKKNKLLSVEISDGMVKRQLNDTRYISRLVMNLLSNIVRGEKNDDSVNSTNVLPCTGQITAILKKDWGMEAVWNDLILPRFRRLNEITETMRFTYYHEKLKKDLPVVPLEFQKGFQKKRIDHRHHALDALVIACATRSHINFLNNQNAVGKGKEELIRERHDLRVKLCQKKYNERSSDQYKWTFKQPWETFVTDSRAALHSLIVSFKQNTRVINKTVNNYQILTNGKKEKVRQQKGESWAIRKSLHKDTVSGLVKLRMKKIVSFSSAFDVVPEIVDRPLRKHLMGLISAGSVKKDVIKMFKENGYEFNGHSVSKVEVFYWADDNVASRVSIDSTFTPAKIETITDSGIQRILLRHLHTKGDNPEVAFSPEGIEEMNQNIIALNGGKFHQPILKVRTFETLGNKFPVGQTGNKKEKYVEAAKGTNLFFAIYEGPAHTRSFETVPLNIVIERQKQNLFPVPIQNEKGQPLAFCLSPNDLVYLPTEDERNDPLSIGCKLLTTEQYRRVYKVVSFYDKRLYAVPAPVAVSIVDKLEFTQLNKMERSLEGEMIKEACWKIECDRLGKIIRVNNRHVGVDVPANSDAIM